MPLSAVRRGQFCAAVDFSSVLVDPCDIREKGTLGAKGNFSGWNSPRLDWPPDKLDHDSFDSATAEASTLPVCACVSLYTLPREWGLLVSRLSVCLSLQLNWCPGPFPTGRRCCHSRYSVPSRHWRMSFFPRERVGGRCIYISGVGQAGRQA